MLPRTAIARTGLSRQVLRSKPAPAGRSWQRYQWTSTGASSGAGASHVAAGIAGGATVVLAGYAWYHTSGLKTAVQTSKDVKAYLQSTRDSVVQKARETAKNPNKALAYLRDVTKSYASLIPGASGYVDTTFDQLDELHDAHREEMDEILSETVNEIQQATSSGKVDITTAAKVYEIVRKSVSRMQDLGEKAGNDILEKNPAIKEKLGAGYKLFMSLAGQSSPEAKKIASEVRKQLKELASKGSLDEGSLKKAKQMLEEKTTQLSEMAQSSGGAILEGGSENLQALLKNVPGGDGILEKAPHLKDIMQLTSERSEDAKELAKETFQDVLNVLEEKGKKAKDLTERTKKDAEKKTKS